MGYMRHNAIVLTSQDRVLLNDVISKANELGLTVLGPSFPAINEYSSILICPDGSIEGWVESIDFDSRRAKLREWLYIQRSYNIGFDWVEVGYNNEYIASIVDQSFTGRTIFEE